MICKNEIEKLFLFDSRLQIALDLECSTIVKGFDDVHAQSEESGRDSIFVDEDHFDCRTTETSFAGEGVDNGKVLNDADEGRKKDDVQSRIQKREEGTSRIGRDRFRC